jgi:hypothetical protein
MAMEKEEVSLFCFISFSVLEKVYASTDNQFQPKMIGIASLVSRSCGPKGVAHGFEFEGQGNRATNHRRRVSIDSFDHISNVLDQYLYFFDC